jgi:hypothetical protein
MEDVGIFYGHLVYLRPFGVSCGNFVDFMVIWLLWFWYVVPKKNLATLIQTWHKIGVV